MTPWGASDNAIELCSRCSRGYNGTRHEGVESEATRAVAAEAGPHYRDSLKAWGGTWMWDLQSLPEDLGWVAEAMQKGTLIGVLDGSYNRKWAPDTCAAGWVVCCRESGRFVSGSFAEVSALASSYRGK